MLEVYLGHMGRCDSQPVWCSLTVPQRDLPRSAELCRVMSGRMFWDSYTQGRSSASRLPLSWRHLCRLRTEPVCKFRRSVYAGLLTVKSLRVAATVAGSAAQRFQEQGLWDSFGFFLIVSRIQISTLYSRHKEGENGKARKHSICTRKIKVFPEISHFSLCTIGQNSITWPPQGIRDFGNVYIYFFS